MGSTAAGRGRVGVGTGAGTSAGTGRAGGIGGSSSSSAADSGTGRGAGRGRRTSARPRREGGLLGWLRPPKRGDAIAPGPEPDERLRRRRRWFIAAVSAAAALVVIALCAGTVGLVSAVGGFRERAANSREDRQLRDSDCLELEQRLNRLVPPGATSTPQARAVAVRDENAAVRIYVNEVRERRNQDGWRQLLDARTAYAEALDVQAKSRTPAFFVAPRTTDGGAVSDQLVSWSPGACAGPIRRLASPEL
jgi:hypothetical protein